MAKISEKYEVIYIVDIRRTEEETAALVEKFNTLVREHGEIIGEPELWGKRRLAYPIDDQNEGYYVFLNIQSPPSFPAELDRVFKITDGIVRWLTVSKGE